MEQGETAAKIDRIEPEVAVVTRPPRYRRVALWQAIAGMSIAVAIAGAMVSIEFARALARRTNVMNRRLSALNSTVRRLEHQTSTAKEKLGSARERASAGEIFEKILFASDLRLLRLAPPTEKSKSPHNAPAAATGTLAMSESVGAAMLGASNLKVLNPFQVYRVWWIPKRGEAQWAADFFVNDEGRATAQVDLPAGRLNSQTLTVTIEDQTYSEIPTGPVVLRGRATR